MLFLIVSGLLVHLVFLGSIFDIYFKSPIIHGITPQPSSSDSEAPATRLVLMVADGLRADTFFNLDNQNRGYAPYLRSVIETRGTWGVSHTRMPTESRPGHVAIIAGLYEDPSAIAKGWKENPVEFDSVFNESRYTWSWGSPDILPMFAKGASGNHVFIDTYGSEVEDFSGKSSTADLDTWVFKKVEHFLNSSKSDADLYEKLHADKVVFFLHLLGLDTAGHTHKPHSEEYKENLQVVDSGIRKMEQLFEEFYEHDKKTAYIFTADHGMTDWGSHGAGDVSETETPLVAWGAGVHGPRPGTDSDPLSPETWHLSHKARYDVNQADIAPLMSSLIGVPVPVNSVGILPLDYLDVSQQQLSELMFTNARQMATHYDKKRELTEAGTLSFLYREFPLLSKKNENTLIKGIENHIAAGRYNESISESKELISLSLIGLDYYQNYYQHLLLLSITFGFLGWIAWLLQCLITYGDSSNRMPDLLKICKTQHPKLRVAFTGGIWINTIFFFLVITSGILIYVQSLPFQFYVYCLLPLLIWWSVAREHSKFTAVIKNIGDTLGLMRFLLLFILYVAGIEVLVASFFHRFFLSVGVVSLATWPYVSPMHHPVQLTLLVGWISSCLLLAVFPLLPVVGKEADTNLVALSGCLFLILAIYCAWYLEIYKASETNKPHQVCVMMVQLLLLPIAIWNLLSTSASVRDKQGLLWANQVTSWTLLVVSLCLPMLSSKQMLLRLYSVGLSLIVPFLLLTASHEGLFVLIFMLNIFCWLSLELKTEDASSKKLTEFAFNSPSEKSEERKLSSGDFRRAYFFLFYILLSLFGTGNIASINSFDPTWVRCFLTVFSPFTMTILILWKIMIPFLAVSCIFHALTIVVQAPTEKLFLIVLIFGDFMGLHFLHLVTNQGSWLDIGTSISHYVIVQATVLFLVLLYGIARLLTEGMFWNRTKVEISSSLESGHFEFEETKILPDLDCVSENKQHLD